MKNIISALSLLLLVSSCSEQSDDASREETPVVSAKEELHDIADVYIAGYVTHRPFSIIFSGLSERVGVDDDSMQDNSAEGLAAFQALEDDLLKRITALSGEAWSETSDWVLYETLHESLASNVELRVCNRQWWSVNHMGGWQNGFARIAANQAFETGPERLAAIARWSQLPGYIEQEQMWLEEGLANGYSAPKRVTARVIAQLDKLIDGGVDELPFLSFADGVDDPEFAAEINSLGSDDIMPAIVAFRDFLHQDYLPQARDDLSISSLPDGEACYEALLRDYHSVQIGAAATYERGEATVEANKSGVIERGAAMFDIADFAEILEHVKSLPANRFGSERELLDRTRAMIAVTKEKVTPFFTKLPAQEMIVEPYPEYLKGTGQSSRYEQRPPSQGPATYRINTDNWQIDTVGGAEITAVHEGWPGHHLQIASSHQIDDQHPILALLRSTAYVEGWARYAEALAEEAGIYESGYGEITRRAWPARGMVVDPGLHVRGWTNEQAVAFLIESGRHDEDSANRMLDRIAAIPGQLTAYDTGGLEIFALRADAERRLGDEFDIREFHDRVLENGAIPLSALRTHVSNWINEAAVEER